MAEDIGCDLACYGAKGVQTPVLDRLASDGLKLNRLYCTSPICSTNRTAMITGMYQTSINGHHHRSHRTDGFRLPDPVKPITSYLQKAGYFCALGCGYGPKTDFNFDSSEIVWDGKDWSERAQGQPFFAQIQLRVTHRGNWWERIRSESDDPVKTEEIELPVFLPDHAEIRKDWAMYLDQVERADAQVGEILTRLKNEGILENTIVVFIGDNGRCFHRGKGFLYEDGIKVPGIVYGTSIPVAGTDCDRLVSTIDLSAQILNWAGVPVPEHMQGRPFLSIEAVDRGYVFAARDRWDEVYDKSRTVVGKRFKYIRNDMPEVPVFTFQQYLEKVRPIRSVLWKLYQEGKMDAFQRYYMAPKKPAEELFDLLNDPMETQNLAEDEAFSDEINRLREVLKLWEVATNDMGRYPEHPTAIEDEWKEKIEVRKQKLKSGRAVQ
ncbi:MAG: sulfatase [Opitutales bacterium]|nr:sulfatase [Opitutales bacterium]